MNPISSGFRICLFWMVLISVCLHLTLRFQRYRLGYLTCTAATGDFRSYPAAHALPPVPSKS